MSLDPKNVPPALMQLLPVAQRWGIGDDYDREVGNGFQPYQADSTKYPAKNMQVDPEVFETLRRINWLANCGLPPEPGFELPVEWVSDWQAAIKNFASPEWEDTTLRARNALTVFLSKKHPAQYQEWNKLTEEARKHMVGEIMPTIEEYRGRRQLPSVFSDCVRWDLLAAAMEASYKSCRPPVFFTKLLGVYERGRFPCGWRGEWPNGRLLVI